MKIAVASGKGGTGKTTVAVSLALSLLDDPEDGPASKRPLLLLDCDVEAPDAHLSLGPEIDDSHPATVQVPRIDPDRCNLCGDCAEVCRFNALALMGEEVMVFPELCHGCGSCGLICPLRAIAEEPREIGVLEGGTAGDGDLRFARGTVHVGEPLAVPVIKQLKDWALQGPEDQIAILDAPPGTSCPMVETVDGADFVVLVTEPTPSGLHDLELADEVLQEMGVPAGVIVNRDDDGYTLLEESCALNRLPILLRIPFEREVAEGLARGETLLAVRPEFRPLFRSMVTEIEGRVSQDRGRGS